MFVFNSKDFLLFMQDAYNKGINLNTDEIYNAPYSEKERPDSKNQKLFDDLSEFLENVLIIFYEMVQTTNIYLETFYNHDFNKVFNFCGMVKDLNNILNRAYNNIESTEYKYFICNRYTELYELLKKHKDLFLPYHNL